MTTPSTADGDPDCPDSVPGPAPTSNARPFTARRIDFGAIDAATWDSLVDRSPAATPFSRHCVHKAWWDAYAATAHDQTIAVFDPERPDTIVGIAPLMHRHAIEPGDVASHTALRHAGETGTRLPESATVIYFGASYHADYATVLAAPENLPAVADAVVALIADLDASRWDAVDLRRLRRSDPALGALTSAFERRGAAEGWLVLREQEDVCPVLTLPESGDFEAYLGSLGKKTRHEIRRKLRRAESAGEVVLTPSGEPRADLDAFVDLHQKRWADEGLFPDNEGGLASRRFFAGLLDGCSDFVDLSFLTVGGRRIAAGVTFDDGRSTYYYNAGVDPDARDLSPGVLMVACYVRRAIDEGRRRLDFLRGDESYKYDWEAVDEPIERLLVERVGIDARRE